MLLIDTITDYKEFSYSIAAIVFACCSPANFTSICQIIPQNIMCTFYTKQTNDYFTHTTTTTTTI